MWQNILVSFTLHWYKRNNDVTSAKLVKILVVKVIITNWVVPYTHCGIENAFNPKQNLIKICTANLDCVWRHDLIMAFSLQNHQFANVTLRTGIRSQFSSKWHYFYCHRLFVSQTYLQETKYTKSNKIDSFFSTNSYYLFYANYVHV